MKKILFLISTAFIVNGILAQAPTILGTYLPVVNTEIKQVWIHSGVTGGPAPATLSIPSYGANQPWDYSTLPAAIESGINRNTHTLKTVPTNTYPGNDNGANFPEATHASHWTSPISGFDTVWTYSVVDAEGMHTVGIVSMINVPPLGYQGLEIDVQEQYGGDTGKDLVIPYILEEGTYKKDSSLMITNVPIANSTGVIPNYPITQGPSVVHRYVHKTLEEKGWGTLATPVGTFNDVLLGRSHEQTITYYIQDADNNGSYEDTLHTMTDTSEVFKHFFLRNNTFASSLLMELDTDDTTATANVIYAWYTLPSQIGSIEGNVYLDTISSANPNPAKVPNAEVYLFREHSNFTRNDILDTVRTNSFGTFLFDSIPFGYYRIAARLMNNQGSHSQEHSYLTYFEGTVSNQGNPALGVDWTQCELVNTISPPDETKTGVDIYLRHDTLEVHQNNATPNLLTGVLTGIDLTNSNKQGGDDPMPGIDIIIKLDPSGDPIISTQTDENGEFSFSNLPDGNYKIWVDMPGVEVTSSYNFNVNKGVYNRCEFDFTSNLDSVDRTGQNSAACLTFIQENPKVLDNVSIYPNPFESSAVVTLDLIEGESLTIELYDMTGKLIQTVVNQEFVTGAQQYEIKEVVQSGVYFVKVQIGEETMTKKVVKL
ncbi:MAG: T9SS type A sorting domain-containing protein [Flavobacteriales bacterium]|jgi:hypothetical protein|nr:T9SS type A sorting domain-containing protein [Flavobacteriales bacterium]